MITVYAPYMFGTSVHMPVIKGLCESESESGSPRMPVSRLWNAVTVGRASSVAAIAGGIEAR